MSYQLSLSENESGCVYTPGTTMFTFWQKYNHQISLVDRHNHRSNALKNYSVCINIRFQSWFHKKCMSLRFISKGNSIAYYIQIKAHATILVSAYQSNCETDSLCLNVSLLLWGSLCFFCFVYKIVIEKERLKENIFVLWKSKWCMLVWTRQ